MTQITRGSSRGPASPGSCASHICVLRSSSAGVLYLSFLLCKGVAVAPSEYISVSDDGCGYIMEYLLALGQARGFVCQQYEGKEMEAKKEVTGHVQLADTHINCRAGRTEWASVWGGWVGGRMGGWMEG